MDALWSRNIFRIADFAFILHSLPITNAVAA
jgi:hypothetical protein